MYMLRNDTGTPNHHRAHLLPLNPRSFPKSPPEKVEVPPRPIAAVAAALSDRSRQRNAGALTARLSSKNAPRMWAMKVSYTAPNEGKFMIFDIRKSLMIAPIDCGETAFDLSHEYDDDESDARVSPSSV
jgi:hypothetical protein